MTDIIIQCAEHATTAVGKLKKIEPSIRTEWLEINNLENRADQIYRELVTDLFGSDRSGKEILAHKITLDSFRAAVDSFETLASGIELLTLEVMALDPILALVIFIVVIAFAFDYTNGFSRRRPRHRHLCGDTRSPRASPSSWRPA